MEKDNAFEKLKEIVLGLKMVGVTEKKIVPEAKFIDDLGADSLDLWKLLMALEDGYGEIPDEDAAKILTVGNALDYIKQRLEQRKTEEVLGPTPR